MEEVAKQIKPLHDWQLAFWSNGSNRPPGFFQMRIAADDKRYADLTQALENNRKFWRFLIWKVAVPTLGFIVTALGAGFIKAAPTLRILFEEYVRAHPTVEQRMKNETKVDDPAVQSRQQLSDSPDPTLQRLKPH